MEDRLEQFEKMLAGVRLQYDDCCTKMEALKADGREKSVSFRQLLAKKLELQNMLIIYRTYGLIE